jgi:hypothetical protein
LILQSHFCFAALLLCCFAALLLYQISIHHHDSPMLEAQSESCNAKSQGTIFEVHCMMLESQSWNCKLGHAIFESQSCDYRL